MTAEFPIWHPGNALLYGEPDPENIPNVTAGHYYSFGLDRERGSGSHYVPIDWQGRSLTQYLKMLQRSDLDEVGILAFEDFP